ncbi:hypothetical protein D3C73_1313870 [compost metagenome]
MINTVGIASSNAPEISQPTPLTTVRRVRSLMAWPTGQNVKPLYKMVTSSRCPSIEKNISTQKIKIICAITVVDTPLPGSFITAMPRPMLNDRICPAVCRAINTHCRMEPNINPHRICSPTSRKVCTESRAVSTTTLCSIGVITAANASATATRTRRDTDF